MKCSLDFCDNEVTAVSSARPLCNKHLHMTAEELAQEAANAANPKKKKPANKMLKSEANKEANADPNS